mmetsp:Transcript_34676/g.68265  ORF Transcript_34676/g.68265 Transcript_34676/m.68265 type:complete len:84 (-) Transcript_34676:90-341(-)
MPLSNRSQMGPARGWCYYGSAKEEEHAYNRSETGDAADETKARTVEAGYGRRRAGGGSIVHCRFLFMVTRRVSGLVLLEDFYF